jgi:hypothetical protein
LINLTKKEERIALKMGDYVVGNKKPPVHTRFQKGKVGNPGGKTSEQKKRVLKNAELATKIRGRMLRALNKLIEGKTDEEIVTEQLTSEALKLIKDSEDRGLGTAVNVSTVQQLNGAEQPRLIDAGSIGDADTADLMAALEAIQRYAQKQSAEQGQLIDVTPESEG